jgi:hypothetical protein
VKRLLSATHCAWGAGRARTASAAAAGCAPKPAAMIETVINETTIRFMKSFCGYRPENASGYMEIGEKGEPLLPQFPGLLAA